jgi:hypothetical protein
MRTKICSTLWRAIIAAVMSVISTVAAAQSTKPPLVYQPDLVVPPTPNIAPTGASYNGSVLVTITDTFNFAAIKFTLDGSNPLTSNTAQTYAGPLTLTRSATVQAVAIGAKYNSNTAEQNYTIVPIVPTPVISPAITPTPGAPLRIFNGPTTVSISDTLSGATIRFTQDTSNPLTSNTALSYNGPFALNPVYPQQWYGVITAVATANGYAPSMPAISSFIVEPFGPAPLIMPSSGTYPPGTTVTIVPPGPGVMIAYTTDGSDPLRYGNWTAKGYGGPFVVSSNTTVRAGVTAWPNYRVLQSLEAQAVYTMSANAPTPVQIVSATPAQGSVQLAFTSSTVGTVSDPISSHYNYTVYLASSTAGPFVSVPAAITLGSAAANTNAIPVTRQPQRLASPRVASAPNSPTSASTGSTLITGLTNGQTYNFFITSTAVATALTSAPSNVVSAVPGAAPGPLLQVVFPAQVTPSTSNATNVSLSLTGGSFENGTVAHIVISGVDTPLATTYNSPSQLHAVIPGSLLPPSIAAPQDITVYVQNPGNTYRSHNAFIEIMGSRPPVSLTSCTFTGFASNASPYDAITFTLLNSGPAVAQLSYSTSLVFNGGYNDVGHVYGAWVLQESNPPPPFLTAHGPYSLVAGSPQTFTVSMYDPGFALAGLASYSGFVDGTMGGGTGSAAEGSNPPWFEVYYSVVSPLPSPINYPAFVANGIAGTTIVGCAVPTPTKLQAPNIPPSLRPGTVVPVQRVP